VERNRTWLKYPAPNELSRCHFFHGFLTFPETTELLRGHPAGTFLLRFSHSQPGCVRSLVCVCGVVLCFVLWLWLFRSLVVALINARNEVQQSLVHTQPDKGGYCVGSETYRTIEECVA